MNNRPMNPIRKKLLIKLKENIALFYRTSNTNFLVVARELNNEFISRSRGHGRNKTFIRRRGSRNATTYFPPNKRNGAKECSRRLASIQ